MGTKPIFIPMRYSFPYHQWFLDMATLSQSNPIAEANMYVRTRVFHRAITLVFSINRSTNVKISSTIIKLIKYSAIFPYTLTKFPEQH